ncbi:MAG TPA: HAD-IA family hydrolase [Candidatus Nitrosotenuis sp.]|jgi:FMN phosphatase YigB (HAD superfamily)|nr:HAD-IA family hydrolase [Candidatus Nitrosotenuis sp.]
MSRLSGRGPALKAIFFDVGGVVAHASLEQYAERAAPLFSARPADLRREVQARVPQLERGECDSRTFWLAVGEGLRQKRLGKPADPQRCDGLWVDLLASTLKVDSRILEVCRQLSLGGYRIGVIANVIPEHARYLEAAGVYRPFHPCVLSCRVGARKPEPAIYLAAASQAGAGPEECLLIDDTPSCLEGARGVGMQAYHYTGLEGLLAFLRQEGLLKPPDASAR